MAVVALVSLYDLENNAVRQLAAGLRLRGHRVLEVYFKDWKNNHLEEPTEFELQRLVDLLRQQGATLAGVSLRASAYEVVASRVCARLKRSGLYVVVGGWHATVRPERCMDFADAVCIGEADRSFPDWVDAWAAGGGQDCPGMMVRVDGAVRRNPPVPLIEDLDEVPWRDYSSPDKWVIDRHSLQRMEPMAKDPLHQVMCSIGCIQKCSFCHNSFELDAPGSSLRFRSVDSVLAELAERRRQNPHIRRVRFDDEIFGLSRKWLREFARRYPVEVGLPFDILTEPTVVNEVYADLLAQAGSPTIHIGIQANETVNVEQLQRRASRQTTQRAIDLLTERSMPLRYLVMVDTPGTSEEDKRALFDFLQSVPRPYDLYLFSLTWFPGSAMVEDLLAAGELHPSEVEGQATKTFSQYRVDLGWPRSEQDRWWLSLMVLEASEVVPRRLLRRVADAGMLRERPASLVKAAQLATLVKTARVAGRMIREGELTGVQVRRWWNPQQLITM